MPPLGYTDTADRSIKHERRGAAGASRRVVDSKRDVAALAAPDLAIGEDGRAGGETSIALPLARLAPCVESSVTLPPFEISETREIVGIEQRVGP